MRLDDAFFDHEVKPKSESIGLVISVKGALARVRLFGASINTRSEQLGAEIGAILRIETPRSIVFGMISSLDSPALPQSEDVMPIRIADVEFIGERPRSSDGELMKFQRGVSFYPALGASAEPARKEDLESIFSVDDRNSINVGTVFQDASLPAKVRVNELLGKHFAVLGTTGTGKSCTVALLLQSILDHCPHAHILLLDAHAEYAAAFGNRAEVITYSDLQIPFWMLTFEELVEVIFPDKEDYKTEIEILAEFVRQCKSTYGQRGEAGATLRRSSLRSTVSEDAPVRYSMTDLMSLVDERMGALDHQSEITLYRRLRGALESRMRDERYGFMFSPEAVATELSDVFSRLFRIPVAGKPLAILELTGLPSEVLSVIVSLTSRLAFDFGVRSNGETPITFICEEAHKYISADPKLGFQPARRSIARVAKEGRKYGVSLGIITQRPSDLDPALLSQCNTLISMRLTNEDDQSFVRCAVSDGARGLVTFLPSLAPGEAIAFGEGVALPMRLRFHMLKDGMRPASMSANFADRWSQDWTSVDYAAEIAERCSRNTPVNAGQSRAEAARRQQASKTEPAGLKSSKRPTEARTPTRSEDAVDGLFDNQQGRPDARKRLPQSGLQARKPNSNGQSPRLDLSRNGGVRRPNGRA